MGTVAGLVVLPFVQTVVAPVKAGVDCNVPVPVHEMVALPPDIVIVSDMLFGCGPTAPLVVITPPDLPAAKCAAMRSAGMALSKIATSSN